MGDTLCSLGLSYVQHLPQASQDSQEASAHLNVSELQIFGLLATKQGSGYYLWNLYLFI